MLRKFLILSILVPLITNCTNINFNSDHWKNWDETKINMPARWDMIDDLINNYGLSGKSQSEILMLLGEPDNGISSSEDRYYYDLGPCRSGISYGSLFINFKNAKVVKVDTHCG